MGWGGVSHRENGDNLVIFGAKRKLIFSKIYLYAHIACVHECMVHIKRKIIIL